MRYMLLIYKDEKWWDGLSREEQWGLVGKARDYSEKRRASGFYQGGERLAGTDTATVVRIQDGKAWFKLGPTADLTPLEQLRRARVGKELGR